MSNKDKAPELKADVEMVADIMLKVADDEAVIEGKRQRDVKVGEVLLVTEPEAKRLEKRGFAHRPKAPEPDVEGGAPTKLPEGEGGKDGKDGKKG